MMIKMDLFGLPIKLTLEGHDSYKSCEGGCCTLIAGLVFLIYFIISMTAAVAKPYEWRLYDYEVSSPLKAGEMIFPHDYGYVEAVRMQVDDYLGEDHADPVIDERKFGRFVFEKSGGFDQENTQMEITKCLTKNHTAAEWS